MSVRPTIYCPASEGVLLISTPSWDSISHSLRIVNTFCAICFAFFEEVVYTHERIMQRIALLGFKSIREVERRADIPYGTIRNTKYGHTPTSDKMVKLAATLGVTVSYLLTGQPDDDPFDNPTPPEVYQKQREVFALMEGLSEENYKAAIDYLTYLKSKEELK